MHKYIIKLVKYYEDGTYDANSEVTMIAADSAQQLSDLKRKYERMTYTAEDGTAGHAMYIVRAMQGEYNVIQDWETFCSVNKVLR